MSRLTEDGHSSVFTIPTITKIDLSANTYNSTGCRGVYGAFPSDFHNASPTLDTIQLQKNAISGPLPALDWLTSLIRFDVHYNIMTGALPALPRSLSYFSCANNFIAASIPDSWSQPQQLANIGTLGLAYNQLTGSIHVIGGK